MFIELMWIDSMVRSWITASKGGPIRPTIPPQKVKVLLGILHRHAPSSIASYRRQFTNFDELYHIAGLAPPAIQEGRTGVAY